ncbi:hypothetical protein H0H87_011859 [Tephrocybe sp. NHM501043]|nr:hypothetical protein H0H87_011859 [Tephrocybe sp. NHM501043]
MVLKREYQAGHVTCDNASNNNAMVVEFGDLYEERTGCPFDVKDRHIRCLVHIINLATQVLISTRSKAKSLPETSMAQERDELGLVRAIVVKERSSSQWKELFKEIQVLLDYEGTMGLHHTNKAQQAFLSVKALTLFNAIPAIEAWSLHASKDRYALSEPVINAATNKVDEYYVKLADSMAHIITMGKYTLFRQHLSESLPLALDPTRKISYFKKYWDAHLQDD